MCLEGFMLGFWWAFELDTMDAALHTPAAQGICTELMLFVRYVSSSERLRAMTLRPSAVHVCKAVYLGSGIARGGPKN